MEEVRSAACDHDWRDIDGRWLCIECRAEKPYASDAANRQELPPLLSTYRQRAHERRWWRRWFVIFEPRDLWIGVFVSPEKYDEVSGDFVQRTYFALIPTIVLVYQRWKPGFQIGAEDRGSYADA